MEVGMEPIWNDVYWAVVLCLFKKREYSGVCYAQEVIPGIGCWLSMVTAIFRVMWLAWGTIGRTW